MLKLMTVITFMILSLGTTANAIAPPDFDDKDTQVVYYPDNVLNAKYLHEEARLFIATLLKANCGQAFKFAKEIKVNAVEMHQESFDIDNLSTLFSLEIEVEYDARLKKDNDGISLMIAQDENFSEDYQDISLVSLDSTGIACR